MKKIVNYDNLFVACSVYDFEDEEEAFVQYETFGKVNHHVLINPKRILVYSVVDDYGNTKYYNYETGREVVEKSYRSSYYSTSSAGMSVYCGYINGYFNLPIKGLRDEVLTRYHEKKNEIGYFIPFDEYVLEKIGHKVEVKSIHTANILLKILNAGFNKSFELSHDEEKAKEQLGKIGYHITEKTKKK